MTVHDVLLRDSNVASIRCYSSSHIVSLYIYVFCYILYIGPYLSNVTHLLSFTQAEFLEAQLAVDDLLVDEMKEQMDHLTKLLNEYKKAGMEPPTPNARLLQHQIDRYVTLMKDKDRYFEDGKSILVYTTT